MDQGPRTDQVRGTDALNPMGASRGAWALGRDKRSIRSLVLAYLALLAVGCGRDAEPVGLEEAFVLRRAALEAAGLEIHAEAPELEEAGRRAAKRLEAAGLPATFVGAGEEGDRSVPRIVVGTFREPRIAELAGSFGAIASDPGSFELAELEYRRAEDFLCAVLPDPERIGLPLVLFAGLDAEVLERSWERWVPGWRCGVDVYRAGEFERRLRLSRIEGELRCREIESTRRVLPDRRDELTSWHAPAFVMFVERMRAKNRELIDYARRIGLARELAEDLLGPLEPTPRLTLFAHTSATEMVQETGRLVPAFVSPVADVIHALVGEPGVPDDGGALLIERIAESCLGPCGLDGFSAAVGVWSTGKFLGRPLEEAARDALIFLSEAESRSGSLFSAASLPAQLVVPLRAEFVEVVRQVRGAEGVRELWTEGFDPSDADLEQAFGERVRELRSLAGEQASRVETGSAQPGDGSSGLEWSIGVGGWTGWPEATERAEWVSGKRFESFAKAGSNFLRVAYPVAAGRPDDGWFHPEEHLPGVGEEHWFAGLSDLERVALCQRARTLGMEVALEPRLLESPSAGLSGWEVLASEAAWNEWFDRAERMLGAHALVAERAGAAWFLLPGELETALVSDSDHVRKGWTSSKATSLAIRLAELRLTRWIDLIAKLRSVYSGRITLSVHNPAMFDAVGFWSELDAVGAEFFQPWPSFEDRGQLLPEAELARAMSRIIGVRAKFARDLGKPLFLFAAGYPRTNRAAERPWTRGGELDGTAQDQYFHALETAIERGRPNLPGWIGLSLWSLPDEEGAALGRGFGLDADRLRSVHPGLFDLP